MLRYVAVGKLYALGVVVQVVVDVGNVARAVHCERAVGVIVDVPLRCSEVTLLLPSYPRPSL